MPDPLHWLDDELQRLDREHLRRHLRVRTGMQDAVIDLDGRTVVNFGSNDYLGLAADRRLVIAAANVAADSGWGSGSSPLIIGRSDQHDALEQALALFEHSESALVFNTGFAANASIIPAIVGAEDVIFSDALNHASIVDGCRLAKAPALVYRHRDVDHLEQLLREPSHTRRRLIVTDTLFSMDGDLAPLAELSQLASRYDAMLMVDEAHATGVFGQHGRGLCEVAGIETEQQVAIRMGTLSKALGGCGGFVTGPQKLIDWLVNRARAYVFSTALPAAACAASVEALNIVKHEAHRRLELLARAETLREQLQADGWNIGDSASQIIPLIIGDPAATVELARQLMDRGYFVPAIRPPSVPASSARLRISLSWLHTQTMIDDLVITLRTLRPTVTGHAS